MFTKYSKKYDLSGPFVVVSLAAVSNGSIIVLPGLQIFRVDAG